MSQESQDPLRLKELTPEAAASALARDSRLILPVGTVDAAHPDLPLSASTIIVERLADDLSAEFGVLRAPTVEYGVNESKDPAPAGTVTLRKKTLHRALNDLVATWECHGVTEFILLTAHGYDPHQEAIATVGAASARVRVVDLFAVNLSDLEGVRRIDDDRSNTFAALLLFIAPSLVKATDARPETAEQGRVLYERIRERISERIFLAPVPAE